MPVLNLSDVQLGMITAAPVHGQGRMLLGEGCEINEKMLRIFKTWGVTEVDVDGGEVTTINKEELGFSPKDLQRIKDELDFLFQKTDPSNEIMSEIRRLCHKRKLNLIAVEQEDSDDTSDEQKSQT